MTAAHLPLLDRHNAPAASARLLDDVGATFGMVPNMFRATANSPAALQMMWSAFGALGKGSISPLLGEKVAVAIANRNRCEYCLAAHTMLGQKAGASAQDMAAAQLGRSEDTKTAAALTFALKVVEQRAAISGTDIAAMREAGYDNEAIAELLAHVALNLFTNYVNVGLAVPVDFPAVKLS
jgi:uncharacterized peroxidase-related enzyme